MNTTILITGGAGFIGSHIVDRLIARSFRVVVLDNFSSGKRENLHREAIFYEVDLADHTATTAIFKTEKPEFVFHFSAQVSASFSLRDPRNDARQNIIDLVNVLDCAHRVGTKKLFFASSAAVYGDNPHLPLTEAEIPDPINFYGLTKRFGEEFLKMYHRLLGLDFVIGRFSNVYGPRQSTVGESGVIALFTHAAAHGQSISIEGDGAQTRDFIFVENLADAIVSAFFATKNEIFNFSTGTQNSIADLATMLKILEPSLEISHREARKGDIRDSVLSNKKLIQLLPEMQFLPLSEGISKTLAWYRR